MKQTIRLTESELKKMIAQSVKRALNEADSFKQVDNLNDYVTSNGLQMKPASKFQRVNAQSGKSYINQYGKQNGMDKRQIGRMVRRGGAPLSTVAGDGTQETNNIVTKNHTVLNNVGNTANRWAAETPTFNRKYEQDPTRQGVYKPKGGPMNAAQINEPISFTAPWGERMNVDKGGYILQDPNNPNDIYGISGKDFDSTYKFNEGKNRIRMSEAQLRQIVKESVEQVLSEAYSDAQYAHLAGQANGALNSFGGKLKGMFNPKWKSRKERQMRQFANQATHDNPGYERSSTKGGDNNDGGNTYEMPEHNYTWSNGGQADYIANNFNPQNQESPFEMKRTQRYVTVDDPSNIFSKRSSRAMANDGDVYSRGETRDMSKKYADNNEWDKVDAIDKLRDSNSRLNRAFNKGKEARNGGTYGGYNGTPTYKNGTGTQSGAFKRLK